MADTGNIVESDGPISCCIYIFTETDGTDDSKFWGNDSPADIGLGTPPPVLGEVSRIAGITDSGSYY